MSDYEKLGKFYLGREHDLATGETGTQKLLYDSKDLTTHAVCVGMTGSGKTGLCLSLLEEAAIDGIPAIAIDPKGDLGNLLLAFPNLAPDEFRPWIDESAATRKGMTSDEFAADRAELWRKGLDQWDQGPERIRKYLGSAERVIYTPGSNAGIPLTILKSFDAPPPELLNDAEAFRERISSAISGLLALVGIDADPVQSREFIFLCNLLDTAWRAGRDLDIPQLIREIQQPPFDKVGVLDLESFFPSRKRSALAMSLNNLLASPSFQSWMQGQPLDVQKLLYTDDGRPKLSILSIAHLNDAERMFFVTILLNEVLAWMRTQPGTSSLRALLYMDEVFGYFPPVGNPPSKKPMLTLLKQARAFGLGCVLATQNPVDLDYKGLSNAGTWFLGRLQTERDKARVLEGLEGASAQAGSSFDRGKMEQTLASLGSRVFLMNNVHDNRPTVFHTRWALSFLRGPLTRGQIKQLMDPVRDKYQVEEEEESKDAESGSTQPTPATKSSTRPILSGKIREEFLVVNDRVPDGYRLVYRPGLLGSAKVHFVRASWDVDVWNDCYVLQTFHDGDAPDSIWEGAYVYDQDRITSDDPEPQAEFADLPAELARDSSYRVFNRQLKSHLYRTRSVVKWFCDDLDAYSEAGEEQADFRTRVSQQARQQRDQARETLEAKHEAKKAKLGIRIERYRSDVEAQRTQFLAKVGGALWAVLELVLSAAAGGSTKRRASSSMSKARQAATERGQQSRAVAKLEEAEAGLEQLESEQQDALEELNEKFDPQNLEFDRLEVKPRKADISIGKVTLVWLPWRVDTEGNAEPVY